VLLALCKAAPFLQTRKSADKLASQLTPYILEAHTQVFLPSPFFQEIEPSPIEALSYSLTSALLSLGINHGMTLQDAISQGLWNYLRNCARAAEAIVSRQEQVNGSDSPREVESAISVARLTISMLGFLDAAAAHANFWTAAERLKLIERVKGILSEAFLVSIETAFSTIRNSHSPDRHIKEWKRYFRHYAVIGRPLGAMLLQRCFMALLVAGSSLLLVDISVLRGKDILDLMMSGNEMPRPTSSRSSVMSLSTIETLADLASDEMCLLEDGADYLRLGSAWQQRLAFTVKACALISYLNCAMLNEDAADVDTLMTWLEDALADPIQVGDETLASVVLRCMALVAKISPGLAPNISRILPRFIVQGGAPVRTVAVASTCLAYVLRMLSQDAIITTLYTLGNVLSSGTAERALAGGVSGELANGNGNANLYSSKQSTGSAISLAITGEEETSAVYGNVVQAICGIASSCNDDKITALAQSMLIQKINKVSKTVDARIITEAAVLAVHGGALEFKSLLKLYTKLTQDGVAQNDEALLAAVSCFLLPFSNISRNAYIS
jgi:phosphatidylinositol 4-kinase